VEEFYIACRHQPTNNQLPDRCSGNSQHEQRSIIAEISAAVCGDLLHNCSLGIQRTSIAGARSLKEPLLAKFFQPGIFRLRDAVGGEEQFVASF
jgi:hypothetical protein